VTTLKYPEIKPVSGPAGDSLVVNMPDVNGIPPTEYQIMEIIIDRKTAVTFMPTVVIYDENDNPVFNVGVLLRVKNKVFHHTQPL
jgi:hypothetical protein